MLVGGQAHSKHAQAWPGLLKLSRSSRGSRCLARCPRFAVSERVLAEERRGGWSRAESGVAGPLRPWDRIIHRRRYGSPRCDAVVERGGEGDGHSYPSARVYGASGAARSATGHSRHQLARTLLNAARRPHHSRTTAMPSHARLLCHGLRRLAALIRRRPDGAKAETRSSSQRSLEERRRATRAHGQTAVKWAGCAGLAVDCSGCRVELISFQILIRPLPSAPPPRRQCTPVCTSPPVSLLRVVIHLGRSHRLADRHHPSLTRLQRSARFQTCTPRISATGPLTRRLTRPVVTIRPCLDAADPADLGWVGATGSMLS